MGQILHDVPVALNQLLHLISLFVTIIFLSFILIFILAVLLISLPSLAFLLFGSFLKKGHIGDMNSVFCFFTRFKHIVMQKTQFELPLRTRWWRAVCPSRRRSWPDPSTAGTPSIGRTRWTESEIFLWSGCWRRNN